MGKSARKRLGVTFPRLHPVTRTPFNIPQASCHPPPTLLPANKPTTLPVSRPRQSRHQTSHVMNEQACQLPRVYLVPIVLRKSYVLHTVYRYHLLC